MAPDPFLDPVAIQRWATEVGIARLMVSRWGWPIAECLHFIGLSLLFGTVGLFDLRMLGVARGITLRHLHELVPFGVAGFALSVMTGMCFFVTAPDQYLYNPAMQTKLALMGIAGINMIAFYATSASRGVDAAPADAVAPRSARAFAVVSLLCWLGVILCGRVITAFRPPFHWCAWC